MNSHRAGGREPEPGLWFLTSGTAGATADAVGQKAAGLMRMAAAGLPVPPGFVLDTGVCQDYCGADRQLGEEVITLVTRGIQQLERETGKRLGGARRPLLVAVRSGAAVSMPGMLETILNVGLCEGTLPGLLRASGDPRFAWDSYRRLIESFGEVVHGCSPASFTTVLTEALRNAGEPDVAELDCAALRESVSGLKAVYKSSAGRPFPQDPMEQLLGAIEAVMRSWKSARAVEYRRLKGLDNLAGTAVTVQAMVFGNMGITSGSGVGFSRDPATGERRLYSDFLLNAQGEDVVSGRFAAGGPDELVDAIPGLAGKLNEAGRKLEAIFGDAQDFEFTVEDGTLWLLQTRSAKRTPRAALQIACDLVDEGLIEPRTACARLRDYDLDTISTPRLAPGLDAEPVGKATPASSGVAVGPLALTIEDARRLAEQGTPAILVRPDAATEDIAGLAVCQGLLTAAGARTSHAAVVARELGLVCLVGCTSLSFGPAAGTLRIGAWQGGSGDVITVDGSAGRIYPGALELVREQPADLIEKVRTWQRDLAA